MKRWHSLAWLLGDGTVLALLLLELLSLRRDTRRAAMKQDSKGRDGEGQEK